MLTFQLLCSFPLLFLAQFPYRLPVRNSLCADHAVAARFFYFVVGINLPLASKFPDHEGVSL